MMTDVRADVLTWEETERAAFRDWLRGLDDEQFAFVGEWLKVQ